MIEYHWGLLQQYIDTGLAENRITETAETKTRLSRYNQAASGEIDDRWIITAADHKFWHFVVSFIASLRDVVHYQGHVGVIDYGLTGSQCSALKALDVEIIQPRRNHALIIDRYFTIAEHFAEDSDTSLFYFDADIWFTEPFDELFDVSNIHDGHIVAVKDVWECDYYYKCAPVEYHPDIKYMLADVISTYGQSLQAGFIGGSSGAWLRLTDLMNAFIEKGFAGDCWGTDALALNFYSKLFEDQFTLLPITYNAPPAWGVVRKDNHFYATKFEHDALHRDSDAPILVKAIHRTSPFRGPNQHEQLAFEKVHPEIFKRWSQLMDSV